MREIQRAYSDGIASVKNGLSLCSLHHAAYDRNILRIRSDYVIKVEKEWIEPIDQFARIALDEFDGKAILLPVESTHRPNPDFLESRFRE